MRRAREIGGQLSFCSPFSMSSGPVTSVQGNLPSWNGTRSPPCSAAMRGRYVSGSLRKRISSIQAAELGSGLGSFFAVEGFNWFCAMALPVVIRTSCKCRCLVDRLEVFDERSLVRNGKLGAVIGTGMSLIAIPREPDIEDRGGPAVDVRDVRSDTYVQRVVEPVARVESRLSAVSLALGRQQIP